MQKNLITALAIAVAVFLWLMSGALFNDGSEQNGDTSLAAQSQQSGGQNASKSQSVRVQLVEAQSRQRTLAVRGKTESKRQVEVKAQVSGAVIERAVERGQRVARGDLLCRLAIDDRKAALVQAEAELKQAEIEYDGTLKLQARGLLSKTAIAAAEARLETARAVLQRQQIELAKTRIAAPFAGIVDKLHMHEGDYASTGSTCVTLVDLDPMLVTADLAESDVNLVRVGDPVTVRTSSGKELSGEVTFIASQSNAVTRTYPMEVTIDNSDFSVRSGLTASLEIKLSEVLAHLVSPALFTLNDRGEVGLRIVDDNNKVRFYPVSLVEDTSEGAWVTGLPSPARLITVGQEFVLAGQTVDPVAQEATELGNVDAPAR